MLIILIILTILAIWLFKVANDKWTFEGTEIISAIGAICLGIIDLIIVIVAGILMASGMVANEKIKMYQQENTQIQENIDTIVKNYMEYENTTLKSFKSENPVTYVTLYPELKANELVAQQVNIYVENNNKIKELKEAQIDAKIGKWLLYFGS